MMMDTRDAPSVTTHSSNTMQETADRPPVAIDVSGNADPEKQVDVDDGTSSKASNEEAKKEEKEGRLKDYFVSHRCARE